MQTDYNHKRTQYIYATLHCVNVETFSWVVKDDLSFRSLLFRFYRVSVNCVLLIRIYIVDSRRCDRRETYNSRIHHQQWDSVIATFALISAVMLFG